VISHGVERVIGLPLARRLGRIARRPALIDQRHQAIELRRYKGSAASRHVPALTGIGVIARRAAAGPGLEVRLTEQKGVIPGTDRGEQRNIGQIALGRRGVVV
jgi:hypothetical protein